MADMKNNQVERKEQIDSTDVLSYIDSWIKKEELLFTNHRDMSQNSIAILIGGVALFGTIFLGLPTLIEPEICLSERAPNIWFADQQIRWVGIVGLIFTVVYSIYKHYYYLLISNECIENILALHKIKRDFLIENKRRELSFEKTLLIKERCESYERHYYNARKQVDIGKTLVYIVKTGKNKVIGFITWLFGVPWRYLCGLKKRIASFRK